MRRAQKNRKIGFLDLQNPLKFFKRRAGGKTEKTSRAVEEEWEEVVVEQTVQAEPAPVAKAEVSAPLVEEPERVESLGVEKIAEAPEERRMKAPSELRAPESPPRRLEARRSFESFAEEHRPEQPKAEASKAEIPKAEAPKAEASKIHKPIPSDKGPHKPAKADPAATPSDAETTEPRHWFHEYWRRVGGGSLTISLIIHLVGLLIAIFLVTSSRLASNVDFLPGGGSKSGDIANAEISNQVRRKRLKVLQPISHRVISNSTSASIKLPDMPLERPDMPSSIIPVNGSSGMGRSGSGGGYGTGNGIGGQSGFINLPPMLRGRCNSADRLRKLSESGGTPECETAVNKALAWLKTKQNPDGSWGNEYKCAMTGFALLSYLGHCETPESPFYGDQVMKGMLYLMETQNGNKYNIISTNPASSASTYEHGIATYALGEMYSLSRLGNRSLPGVREAFERGVKVIIDHQRPYGGWAYDSGRAVAYATDSAPNSDLSVTGWQYQALKAAKYSGLAFPGLNVSIDKTVKYLEGTQTKDGGFGETRKDVAYSQWSLSGVAILGLQTLSHGDSRAIDRGIVFSTHAFRDDPPDWKTNANLYCWYYYSQAFFQYGGAVWKGWNARVLHQLLENQKNDGSWNEETADNPLASTRYAGDDREIYRNTLCTLMLEIYYRYLKVGDREARSMFDRR